MFKMNIFDNELLGKNIKFLASKNDLKIGEIEKEAGVSPGYISRLSSSKNDATYKLMDLIFFLSEKTDVSVLTLLTVDIAQLTKSEAYLTQFLEKLCRETKDEIIYWQTKQPETWGSPSVFPRARIVSSSQLVDDIVAAAIKEEHDQEDALGEPLYCPLEKPLRLNYFRSSKKQANGLRLSFYGAMKPMEVCTLYEDFTLYPLLQDVYTLAKASSTEFHISKAAQNFIDDYINGGGEKHT